MMGWSSMLRPCSLSMTTNPKAVLYCSISCTLTCVNQRAAQGTPGVGQHFRGAMTNAMRGDGLLRKLSYPDRW